MMDCESEIKRIGNFIKTKVEDAGAKGVVLGVSGGIDSALVLYLAVEALGNDKVFALILPTNNTPQDDLKDAMEIVDILGVPNETFSIEGFLDPFRTPNFKNFSRIAYGNIQARIRMVLQYYYANNMNYLVIGTTDATENFLGFFTKWGDGGVDLEPIIHLTKSDVRVLASYIGVPEHIVKKKSSPRLWPGHEAEKELGLSYDTVDKMLEINKKTNHKREKPDCVE